MTIKEEGEKFIREYQLTGSFKNPDRVLELLGIILGEDYLPTTPKATYHILYSQLES